LLFIAYISDLPKLCETENVVLKLFADDLKAYHISRPSEHFHVPLQQFIAKLTVYCNNNSLQIAVDKCNAFHIGPKNPNHDYSLANSLIPNIKKGEAVRDLGVYFTSDLKWRSHIDITVKKARRTSFALLKSIKSNDPAFLVSMFKTYILPILEFACPIFNPFYAKDIHVLEKVQRDYVRLVYKRSRDFRKNPLNKPTYPQLLACYELELLEIRRLKFCLTTFHKYINGLTPMSKTDAFRVVETKTRGESVKIVTKPYVKDVRHNSFFPRISNIYSKLPSNLRLCNPIEFSKLLDSFDLSQYLIGKEYEQFHRL